MRQLFFILCCSCFHPAFGQDDFLSLFYKMEKISGRQRALQDRVRTTSSDTTQRRIYHKEYSAFYWDSVLPIITKVTNLTFPDVSFTSQDNKAYSLSDFPGTDLIINYNYLYCQPCIDRIDSTYKYIEHKKIKMLVFFTDAYKNEIGFLKMYNHEYIIFGFLNEDNKDLVSLYLGDDSMYYLSENRQIEFFDRTHPADAYPAWTHFLKEHTK